MIAARRSAGDTSDAAIAYAIAADHAAYVDQARGDALKDEYEAAWRNYDAAMEAARCALRDALEAAWRDYAAAFDALAGGGAS